jgi:hypothetical protein
MICKFCKNTGICGRGLYRGFIYYREYYCKCNFGKFAKKVGLSNILRNMIHDNAGPNLVSWG